MAFLAVDILGERAVIDAPALLVEELATVLTGAEILHEAARTDIRLSLSGDDWRLEETGSMRTVSPDSLLHEIMEALYRVAARSPATVLNAVALGLNGRSILLLAESHEIQALSAVWGIDCGFDYMGSAVVAIEGDGKTLLGFPGPIALAKTVAGPASSFEKFKTISGLISNDFVILSPASERMSKDGRSTCVLTIVLNAAPGAALFVEPLDPPFVRKQLKDSVRRQGGASQADHETIAALADHLPALFVSFGTIEQLSGVVDHLMRYVLTCAPGRLAFAELMEAATLKPPAAYRHPIPSATPKLPRRTLTIGMATYDDYDGVYFTVQALRLYHPEIMDDVEILIVDNNPSGPAAAHLKSFDTIAGNLRYVPLTRKMGSSAAKNHVFEEAAGDFVLCLDCHVLIVPGALRRLLDYLQAHPATKDLLQGPIVHDDQARVSTHWIPGWQAGLKPGTWAEPVTEFDHAGAPFAIPMQGLGLFACRRAAWPGFNPRFRGFGGEEGYLHEKFRQRSAETLCLPFLGWVHRFARPFGPPPTAHMRDVLRNHLIGHRELGLPTDDLLAFARNAYGSELVNDIVRRVDSEVD